MQKSITSFFGAPKDGAGAPPSPPKARAPISTKPSPKSKAKAKAKAKPKPRAKKAGTAKPTAKTTKKAGGDADGDGSDGDEDAEPPTTTTSKAVRTASPTKAGAAGAVNGKHKGKADDEQGDTDSDLKTAGGKRKAATTGATSEKGGEKDAEKMDAAAQDDGDKEDAEDVGDAGGGEDGPVQKPKRLRRLAERAADEDSSDDDMFGAGAAVGNTDGARIDLSASMDVVESDDQDGNKGGKVPVKAAKTGMKGKPRAASAKPPRGKKVTADAADAEEEEPDTAGEEDMDADDESDASDGVDDQDDDDDDHGDDGDDDEVEEVEGASRSKSKGGDNDKKGTVAGALMAGAKRAKSAPPPKKKVKGSTAAGIVMAKTEDLVAKACWKKGQAVPFKAVAEMFDKVEQTSKRLEIVEILRAFLCTVITLTPEDLVPCVYLACNELAPAYEGMELGIGDMVLQKAIQGATGRSAKDIKSAAQEAGDLGEVAQHSTKAQGTLSFGQTIKELSARDILERFRAIARVKGSASGEDKINRIKKMLVSCKGLQAKYIIRGLQGKMRIGLTSTTVMVSLSHAAVTCPSEAALAAEDAERLLVDQKKENEIDEKKKDNTDDKKDNTDNKKDNAGDKEKEEAETKDEAEDEEKKNVETKDKVDDKEKVDSKDDEGQKKDERPAGDTESKEKAKQPENSSVEPGGADEATAAAEETPDGEVAVQSGEVDGLIPVAVELRDTPVSPRYLEHRLDLACQLVKQAYSECPNLDLLIKAVLEAPLFRLQQKCRLTPGVPVSPMLAKPTKSIGEVLQRLSGQEFTCEYKYDGVRAQVHLMQDGSLRFFSRSSKDSSSELPDLIPVMKDCATDGVSSYVIDTEVVAYDRDTGNLLPFQMLSTRGRKDVDAKDVKVKVIVEAFDMLYLNGQSLLQRPLKERRELLRSTFKEIDGRFRFATFMDHKEDGDTGPIEEFLSEAVKGNCEGLMVKTLTSNSSYEPSKRSLNWLKLKKDYLQADGGGVGDSLDLVPIGAFFGKGKRTGKYGAYLLACYEPDREEYQSVCKIGTGFTDEILLSFWEELKEHTVENRPRYYNVADSLSPDVWLAPHKVWEVKCADLSKSPVHKAAIGKISQEPDRGISIRFPRLLREREDKDPEQATTSDQILDMYESQDVVKSNVAGAQNNNADDDWEL